MNKKMIIIGTALFIALIAFSWGVIFLWKVSRGGDPASAPSATVVINNTTYPVEVVRTMAEQARGLANRDSLTQGQGMLFPFASKKILAFTMHGMRFPLDIIWIADGVVVDISANLPPDEANALFSSVYKSGAPANMVLELNAGAATGDGIKVGDRVVINYK